MSASTSARASARAERRRRAFEGKACVVCGLTEPFVLKYTPVRRISRIFLEDHHIVGRANDPDATIPLCLNHHALATEAYRRGDADMKRQPTLLHKLMMVLRSLSACSQIVGVSFDNWGGKLEDFIEQLDHTCPGWRDIEVAE